jgi:hypothetical protein
MRMVKRLLNRLEVARNLGLAVPDRPWGTESVEA